MTSNWEIVKIEDILLIPSRNGLTKPSAIRGKGVKMIAMGELFAHPIICNINMDRVPVNEKELKSSNIQVNDLLFARQSLSLEGAGKCSIVKEVHEPTVFESHLIRLRINNKLADPWFVYYYFNSYYGKHSIQNIVNQVAAAGIKGSDLVKIEIPLPSLDIQNKIATQLSEIDDKIAVNKKICENLEAQAQALFKHWFVDFAPFKDGKFVESELGLIPEGWRVGRLEEIAEVTMGQSPAGSSYNEKGEGVIFYQGRTEFGFRYPSVRLYTTEPKRFAEPLSTLLSVRAPVGDINMASNKCCIGRGLASIKSNMNCHSYIFYLLQSLKRRLDVYNGEGTVFGSINKDTLNGLKIIIPSNSIISEFEEIVEEMDKKILESHQENLRLSSLRDTLLPKLMSGQIKLE